MPISIGTYIAGFLLSTESSSLVSQDLEKLHSISTKGDLFPGWPMYEYVTMEPIPGADAVGAEPPYRHNLILRWGRTSLLALSNNHRIVRHIIYKGLKPLSDGSLRQNEIRVHQLVNHILRNDIPDDSRTSGESMEGSTETADHPIVDPLTTNYVLSYAGARTDAFGEDLRKLQFYGDRISKAGLFRDCAPLMRFNGCTLRRNGADIITLSRSGFVSFIVPVEVAGQRARFKEVNGILRMLTDQGFIL
jgi:hypothetical protein